MLLGLLGWAIGGISGLVDAKKTYTVNQRIKESTIASGGMTYRDAKGKEIFTATGEHVYRLHNSFNGREELRSVKTGKLVADVKDYRDSQTEYNFKTLAEQLGKKAYPVKNDFVEGRSISHYEWEHGIVFDSGREFIAPTTPELIFSWWINPSTTLKFLDDKMPQRKILTFEEFEKYKVNDVRWHEKLKGVEWREGKSYPNEFLDKKKAERLQEIKESMEQAERDHISRLKEMYGENYIERDGRDINDVFVLQVFPVRLNISTYFYLFSNIHEYCDPVEAANINHEAFFTLCYLLQEFLQRFFDEKFQNKYGRIRITDVRRGSSRSDILPLLTEKDFNFPFCFKMVVEEDFVAALRAEATDNVILHKIMLKGTKLEKEQVSLGLSSYNLYYLKELLGGEEEYDKMMAKANEYIRKHLSLNTEWVRNYNYMKREFDKRNEGLDYE